MDILGTITGIKYNIFCEESLKVLDIDKFDINKSSACCILKDANVLFAVSKWVSPKRSRSYPYQRVYDTLQFPKKITVIPIVKDEGVDGDRDFLQWDTVSLMSLLDVFVIFAYHNNATKKANFANKLTKFQFDNEYVISKIKEIKQYHSSALHWNLNELNNNLYNIVNVSKKCYDRIAQQTGVVLHNHKGIDNFIAKIKEDVCSFMEFSRTKASVAQTREVQTIQPKEKLSTLTKANITITNYLGGQYFFTVDEVLIQEDKILLIESKHSNKSVLPNKKDIKDGLLKIILYSNLEEVSVSGKIMKSQAFLRLTSPAISESISSENYAQASLDKNNFSATQKQMLEMLFQEANDNNFVVQIGRS